MTQLLIKNFINIKKPRLIPTYITYAPPPYSQWDVTFKEKKVSQNPLFSELFSYKLPAHSKYNKNREDS